MSRMGMQGRYGALDGLRGVAALVVVIHHGFLTSASLASAYISSGGGSGWAHVLTYTPLHIIWAGKESVIVFFGLSGLVLTLPRLKPNPESWFAYYPKRLVRLYVPIIAAVLFSVVIVVAVGRSKDSASWWMNTHTGPSISQFVHDVTLVFGHGSLNTALWSLQWEVWFSLLLPAFVWIGLRTRRLGFTTGFVGVGLLVLVGWETGSLSLMYLPVFWIGVLIAVHLDRVKSVSQRLLARSRARWVVVLATALALIAMTAEWWTLGLGAGRTIANVAAVFGVLIGATLLVVMAMFSTSVGTALQVAPIKWLGTRSFSLYLIHEPIVVSVAELVPNRDNPALVTVVGMIISLICAEVFYRLIERPSHSCARWTGAIVSRRVGEH